MDQASPRAKLKLCFLLFDFCLLLFEFACAAAPSLQRAVGGSGQALRHAETQARCRYSNMSLHHMFGNAA
jgi:hypothetical protein